MATSPDAAPTVVHSEFTTADPDEACALVTSAYSANRLRISGSRRGFRFHQARSDLGQVRFDTVCNTLIVNFEMSATGGAFVTRIVGEHMDFDVGGGPQRFGPGEILIASHPAHGYAATLHGLQAEVVSIDLQLLRTVAGDDADPARTPPAESFGRRFTPEAARSWQRSVHYVGSLLKDPAMANPLVLANARRMLAAALLAATGPPPEPGRGDRRDATSRTLRRAVAFIEANPDVDIGVAEIASAAHVSPRAVQLAFRRRLDTTPTAYLRRVRLAHVHAELEAADPSRGDTVTAVAARWGFTRSSRLAEQYRAAYHERPSATLRR